MTMISSPSMEVTDVGDYLKLGACTAVMAQPILTDALASGPSIAMQTGIGVVYNLVKYTAPAFIFGILYTTTRLTLNQTALTYTDYLRQQWHALFIPTIWWTAIYLILMPQLQQGSQYHDWWGFLWQFVNGNAAPHLWYNTMMLQFIILMPLFWALGRWCQSRPRRGWIVFGGTTLVAVLWLWFYDQQVFHGPHSRDWYLLDRLFISFQIFGFYGMLAWVFRDTFQRMLNKWWPGLLGLWLVGLIWTNWELFSYGFPVNLRNAPYYKPSMTGYALAVIGLLAALCEIQVRRQRPFSKFVHLFAGMAYKAYLANVFWSELLWRGFGRTLMVKAPWLNIALCYGLTWLLSFTTAFGLHAGWMRLKREYEHD